jgi:hypothetical protein
VSFTNPTFTVGLKLLNLSLLKVMLICINDGVTTIKPGHTQQEMNAWYGQINHPLCRFLYQEEFMFGEHPRKPTIWKTWFQQWNMGEVLWWFGQKYHGTVFCWSHHYPLWLNYYEYVDGFGKQVHPSNQTLFACDAVF